MLLILTNKIVTFYAGKIVTYFWELKIYQKFQNFHFQRSWKTCIDQEQAHRSSFVGRAWISHNCENTVIGHDSVADEHFRSIYHKIVAVSHRRCFQALKIRSGSRLGHCNAQNFLAADKRRDELALLSCAVFVNVGQANVAVDGEAETGTVVIRLLFVHDHGGEKIAADSADFFRSVDSEKTHFTGFEPRVAVTHALLFPFFFKISRNSILKIKLKN